MRERGTVLTIAKNLLGMGMSIDNIAISTGLSYEDIERLQTADY